MLPYLVIIVLSLASSLALSQVLLLIGIQRGSDLTSLGSLWLIIASLGLFVFQMFVWSDRWGRMFKPQTIVLKTDRTPFQVVVDGFNSCLMLFGSLFALSASFLFFIGRLDLLMQFLQSIAQKLIRIIQILFE